MSSGGSSGGATSLGFNADVGLTAGTLGGVVVIKRGDKQFVRMTRTQAQWYLDHGTIKAVGAPQS